MATTLEQQIIDVVRRIALDQIAQEIEANGKFALKTDIPSGDTVNRLLALEGEVSRLISIVWAQEPIEPLSLETTSSTAPTADAFEVRLQALEAKVSELFDKTWKHKE